MRRAGDAVPSAGQDGSESASGDPNVATSATPGPGEPREEGLYVLHLFLKPRGTADVESACGAVKRARSVGSQVVTAALFGHKADVGVMALSSRSWPLRDLQTGLSQAGFETVYSYTSLTEVSEYAEGIPDEIRDARLYPQLPPEGMAAFSFYPMSKRRQPGRNWYTLPFDERKSLMSSHGRVGREFRGRVVQLVTGSSGLDDYEWGVTLFGISHDDLKACVYEMRFDPASANYADFGPFYAGMVADPATVFERVLTS